MAFCSRIKDLPERAFCQQRRGAIYDGQVKLDGENVVAFPKLPEFQQLTLRVLRWEERNKGLVIKEAEIVP
jgi:hypothetical protein